MKIYEFLARSQHPLAREARALYRRMEQFSLPAPAPLVKPAMWAFLGLRSRPTTSGPGCSSPSR